MAERTTGPRVGDRVQIEAAGTIIEMQAHDHVPGVLIELDEGEPGSDELRGSLVWVPLDRARMFTQEAPPGP